MKLTTLKQRAQRATTYRGHRKLMKSILLEKH